MTPSSKKPVKRKSEEPSGSPVSMTTVSNPIATEWPPRKVRPPADNKPPKADVTAEWPPRRTLAKPVASGSSPGGKKKNLSVADVENAGFKAHDYNEGGFHMFQSKLCLEWVLSTHPLVSHLSGVMTKCTLRSLSLSYQKKGCPAGILLWV